MREFKKYASPDDYLMHVNQILYQEVENWMRSEAYDYNTCWYSMNAFKYFKEHRYEPEECIRAIRMYASFQSIMDAYDLGKKLVDEFRYVFRVYEDQFDDAPRFSYIANLMHKYHVSLMSAIVNSDDWDNSYYITGVCDLNKRYSNFYPDKLTIGSGAMTEDEKLRLYQAIMNVLMNRVDIDEQNRLIDASNLDIDSNKVYAAYDKFMHFYVLGIAYDVENDKIFQHRVLSITDRRIYLEYDMAIEFCIQVYLLGLKTEFMDYVWSFATHFVKDDMLAHHPNASDVKIPVMTPDGISYDSVHWSLPREKPEVDPANTEDKSE